MVPLLHPKNKSHLLCNKSNTTLIPTAASLEASQFHCQSLYIIAAKNFLLMKDDQDENQTNH